MLLVGVGIGIVLIVVLNNEIQQPTIPMVVVQLNEYVATLEYSYILKLQAMKSSNAYIL